MKSAFNRTRAPFHDKETTMDTKQMDRTDLEQLITKVIDSNFVCQAEDIAESWNGSLTELKRNRAT